MSEKKRYAVIREDATELYTKDIIKRFKGRVPPSREWIKTLKKWAGKKLEIAKEYDDRVFLLYPEPEINPDGTKTVGIDLEKKYVIFL